ncbi:MAG: hypothetical protein JRN15_03495 [Nitrososphaerota archaeon]|nr:hypothetical protein [Nitrososphaerota archaeon]
MRSATIASVLLGLAGASLDYASGYLILTNSMMIVNEMGNMLTSYSSSGLGWSIGLFALGTLLLATSIASFSSAGMGRMDLFGLLMIVDGVVMLLIGGAMFLRVTPMMNGFIFSGIGMFVIGALMIVNGGFMRRPMM